jgi:hypothetical protein
VKLQLQRRRRRRELLQFDLRRRKIRFMKDGEVSVPWSRLRKQLEPLFGQLDREDGNARGVAARPRQACNEPISDGIADARKDDRDRFGRRDGRPRAGVSDSENDSRQEFADGSRNDLYGFRSGLAV